MKKMFLLGAIATVSMLFALCSCSDKSATTEGVELKFGGPLADYYDVSVSLSKNEEAKKAAEEETKDLKGDEAKAAKAALAKADVYDVVFEFKKNDKPFSFNADEVEIAYIFDHDSDKSQLKADLGFKGFYSGDNRIQPKDDGSGPFFNFDEPDRDNYKDLLKFTRKPGDTKKVIGKMIIRNDMDLSKLSFEIVSKTNFNPTETKAAPDEMEEESQIDVDDSDAEEAADDVDEVNDGDESSSSGSQNLDALLTSYEQYVDKYIALMKKAANGDMDALGEYPGFMEKAEDLSKKMQNAKGSMSASQWARYNKITQKMMQAAQN